MKGWVVRRPGPQGVRYQAKIRVPDPSRPKGYRDLSRTFGKRKEADAWLAETVVDLGRGALVLPTTATVAELMRLWLDTVAAPKVRVTTLRQYRASVETHIVPGIGDVRVQDLTTIGITQWYRSLTAAGVGNSALLQVHQRLRQALDAAVDWGIVAVNPALRATRPAVRHERFAVWTPEEGARFLAATAGSRHHSLYVLALATGMRVGELSGLRWQDVDLERRTLGVRQQVIYVGGQGFVVSEPKSEAGRRTIALPEEAVVALRRQRVRQNEERLAAPDWRHGDLVFARPNGDPVYGQKLRLAFDADVARAGVPAIRMHDMRHTHATWLLQAGVPVKVVSERLGHASITMTLGTYAHVLPGMQERAADVVQDVLTGLG